MLKRPDGSLTGNVQEMDTLLRAAWLPIFAKHTDEQPAPSVDPFMAHYGAFIPCQPQTLEPLTARQLLTALRKMSKVGAAGLDGWKPRKLQALPAIFVVHLASLFELIELTGVWPVALCSAGVTLIPKGEGAEPLQQRPLTVMPVVYRVWAAARCRECMTWQESWIDQTQHGCRPKHGTTDALLQVASELEAAMLNGEELHGAALDFSKCFDNIPIAIAIAVMNKLGLSSRILDPMIGMYAALTRRFKVRGFVGEEFTTTNGIMQGCPLSVLLLNAMVRVLTAATPDVAPSLRSQSYVDDITWVTHTRDELRLAFTRLEPFLRLTQEVLNEKKTYVFGMNCQPEVTWLGAKLPTKPIIKILGVKFNFSEGGVNYPISAEEIAETQKCLDRIRLNKLPFWARSLTIGGLAIGKLAYGAEVRYLEPTQERAARSSITAAIWNKPGRHRTPGVILTLLCKGHVVDSTQSFITARVLRWLRTARNDPSLIARAWDCRELHGDRNLITGRGPAGLLLLSIRRLRATWDTARVIPFPDELGSFDILSCSVGEFSHALRESARRMVYKQVRSDHARTQNGIPLDGPLMTLGLPMSVDRARTLGLYNEPTASNEDKGLLRSIFAYAVWTAELLSKLPDSKCVSPTCTFCGAADETLDHLFWECPVRTVARQTLSPELFGADGSCIALGWPRHARHCGIVNDEKAFPILSAQRSMLAVLRARAPRGCPNWAIAHRGGFPC